MVTARATVLGVAATALILAGGWELGVRANEAAIAPLSVASPGGTVPKSTGASSAEASAKAGTTASPSATPSTATTVQRFTGAVEQTRYGTVQVELKVKGTSIVDVIALHLTDSNGRSVQISNEAAPILRSEVLKSQSAKVQAVSGATYTTDGYLSSVQSAIDAAGL